MIRENLPYKFNQIETALISFCADVTKKVNQIHDDIPVFFLQNGDISYVLREKFEENDDKELLLKTPRVVLGIEDIQYLLDQNTNQYNKVIYKIDEKQYQTTARRLGINIVVNIDFVSPNFIKALENFEVMSTLVSRDNVFTYEFLGNTFESAYVMQSPSMERPTMDIGGATRNYNVRITFDLQVHLLVPQIDSIIPLEMTEIDEIRFSIKEGDMKLNDDGTFKLFDTNHNEIVNLKEPDFEEDKSLESSKVIPGITVKQTALFGLIVEDLPKNFDKVNFKTEMLSRYNIEISDNFKVGYIIDLAIVYEEALKLMKDIQTLFGIKLKII